MIGVNIDGDDYKLTVTGTITPVRSTRVYDFTNLYTSLIEVGIDETEAQHMVEELCHEIVEELNKKEEDEDDGF